MTQTTTEKVTFKGQQLTLEGYPIEVGQTAPDFKVLNNDLEEKKLSDYAGKVRVIVAVASLNTSVCDMEVKRFNQEAEIMSEDVEVLTISMDLPFAQKNWCAAAGCKRVTTLSDHKDADFGRKYGILIKELRLLARTVFIVDKEGKVAYKQLVSEVTDEPDYNEVLEKIKSLT